jgi:3-methyl-2-oxobutanoate hydroxymethyltransferase
MMNNTDKKKITATAFAGLKGQRKLACVTCYDYTSAVLVDRSDIDAILIGDSASNTMMGNDTTLPITLDQMIYHVRCVMKAAPHCFVMGDMPFGTVHGDPYDALHNAVRMMKEGGCDAVKVEGGREIRASLEMILGANIPVVGHLGLTPQSIHRLGGYGLQAREEAAAEQLLEDARMLDEIGVTAITLEKIPAALAKRVTEEVSVPTIGIGAGPDTDAQILVLQDLLGLTQGFRPKFLRRFAELGDEMVRALDDYSAAVADGSFPSADESY